MLHCTVSPTHKLKPRLSTRITGFTLIELLVAISIMLLIIGGGMAAFVDFNDKQALIGAAKQLQIYLRTAQLRARAGDRPQGCDKLYSYAVRVAQNSSDVQLVAECGNGDVVRDQYQLPGGVSPTGPIDIDFLVLHGGVEGAQTIELFSEGGLGYTFAVTAGGEVTEGALVENQP